MSLGILAEPMLSTRMDFQDAMSRGLGVTEYARQVVPRVKSKHCGAGLALSLMDLRFRMSTYVDRQPPSALSCLFLLQTDPRDPLAGGVASNAQNKGMDRPVFERLPSAPAPKALAHGLRRCAPCWECEARLFA